MATDKAKYITGFTKIVRTAANKAANECACSLADCCAGNSIDATFTGLSDCGLEPENCTSLNGNTYTAAYQSRDATRCVWDYKDGTIAFNIVWYHTAGFYPQGTIVVNPSILDAPTNKLCLYIVSASGYVTTDFPLTLYNDLASGDCGTNPYAGVVAEGYGGQVVLAWT